MNCEKFQTLSADLARGGDAGSQDRPGAHAVIVDASERATVETHVAQCAACADQWRDELELTAKLQALANQNRSLEAPSHVKAEVLARFRERAKVVPLPARNRSRRYWTAVAAAAAILIVGSLFLRSHIAHRVLPQPVAKSTNPDKPGAIGESPRTSTAGYQRRDDQAKKPQRLPHRHLTPDPARNQIVKSSTAEAARTISDPDNSTHEVATDFLPVSYGYAADLQEGGQLLRVELPRSALARFGLPVNMDHVDERVKADVLVGADGMARAIRFVR